MEYPLVGGKVTGLQIYVLCIDEAIEGLRVDAVLLHCNTCNRWNACTCMKCKHGDVTASGVKNYHEPTNQLAKTRRMQGWSIRVTRSRLQHTRVAGKRWLEARSTTVSTCLSTEIHVFQLI
jgi:hypothetical protein